MDQLDTVRSYLSIKYNSRTLNQGFFGLGWCHSIDHKVRIQGSHASYFSCDNGWIQIPLKDSIYQYQGLKVQQEGQYWILYLNDQPLSKFNRWGSFVESLDGSQLRVHYLDQSPFLIEIKSTKYYVTLLEGKISKIKGVKHRSGPTFRYNGHLLSSIQSPFQTPFTFAYNHYYNLTKFIWDNTEFSLKYENSKDRVNMIQSSYGIELHIKFLTNKKSQYVQIQSRNLEKASAKFVFDKLSRLIKVIDDDQSVTELKYKNNESEPYRISHTNYGEILINSDQVKFNSPSPQKLIHTIDRYIAQLTPIDPLLN